MNSVIQQTDSVVEELVRYRGREKRAELLWSEEALGEGRSDNIISIHIVIVTILAITILTIVHFPHLASEHSRQ